jgi:hypothetical protein
MDGHGRGKLWVGTQEIGNVAGVDIRCAVGNANECHVMLVPHELTVEGEFSLLTRLHNTHSPDDALAEAVENWKIDTLREALLELGQEESEVCRLLGLPAPSNSEELTDSPKSTTTEAEEPATDS